jgi:archaellum component FlaG (FlaF/FlaG flagellin family)
MPRFISPPLEELDKLRTPLNEGERIVLDFFDHNLSQNWEIYIQPHLNGLRPDFVLLNPKVGIAVYEVKHWDLKAMPYRIEYRNETPQLWATNSAGIDFQIIDNPVDKIIHYQDQIANLYVPKIGQNCEEISSSYFSVITAGVIFTNAATEEVALLLEPLYQKKSAKSRKYLPLVGIDDIKTNQLTKVFPSAQYNGSKYMEPNFANALRGWLIEPDFAKVQRQPLELNPKQKALVMNRTNSGYRRIRGPAGSGKSLILAGRTAQLSIEDKKILLVSFNITLWHYLRDLVVRYPANGVKVNKNITYIHFHEWCKNIIVKAGLRDEYNKLFVSTTTEESLEKVLEYDVVNLANLAIDRLVQNIGNEKISIEQYDAILVDEGQDFNPMWWNTLRRVLKDNGEMVLVADETQDLYKRTKSWTEEAMNNAGFRGIWNQLDICYRTPNKLIGYLKDFIHDFLPDANINLLNSETEELNLWPVTLTWIQCSSEKSIPQLSTDAILRIPELANPNTVAWPDLTLLFPDHKLGLSCVHLLEKQKFNVLHIFDPNGKDQKSKKMSFFMGDARIKACTIHSFKGWEARYMVIAITKFTDLAAVYVAMSRLKRDTKGSYLTIVCSNPALEEYGKTWPSFSNS